MILNLLTTKPLRIMKKLFSLWAAMLLPLMANAYDLEDKGIFFNVKGDGTLVVVGLDAGTS